MNKIIDKSHDINWFIVKLIVMDIVSDKQISCDRINDFISQLLEIDDYEEAFIQFKYLLSLLDIEKGLLLNATFSRFWCKDKNKYHELCEKYKGYTIIV